jgi:hypothetical protein
MTAKTRRTTDTKQAKKPAAKPVAAKSPPKAAKAPTASKPSKPAEAPKPAKPAEAPKPAKAPITQEMIAARAYQIWLAAGCPQGQDAAIWLRAEAELRKANARP